MAHALIKTVHEFGTSSIQICLVLEDLQKCAKLCATVLASRLTKQKELQLT